MISFCNCIYLMLHNEMKMPHTYNKDINCVKSKNSLPTGITFCNNDRFTPYSLITLIRLTYLPTSLSESSKIIINK